MKKFSQILVCLCSIGSVLGQERPYIPASQAEVNAGTNRFKGVTPFTLHGLSVSSGWGTNSGGTPITPGTNVIFTTNTGVVTIHAVGSGTNAPISRVVDMENYGIVGFKTNNTGGTCPLTITDYAATIQSIVDSFRGDTNGRTIIQFGAGTIRCSTNIWVPENIYIKGAAAWLHMGGGNQVFTHTNNYTQLWFPTANSHGLIYWQNTWGNGLENIEICGGTNAFAPVSGSVTALDNDAVPVSGIGVRAYNEAGFWNQGFVMKNVSITGFKMAHVTEVNSELIERVYGQGCDFGYVSPTTNYYVDLKTDGKDWFNTNYLSMIKNRDGSARTTMAPGEQNVCTLVGWGTRSNSVGWFLGSPRSFTIINDASYHMLNYMWTVDATFEVRGAQIENDNFCGTNGIIAWGLTRADFSAFRFQSASGIPSFEFMRTLSGPSGGPSLNGTWNIILDGVPNYVSPTDGDTGEPLLYSSPNNTDFQVRFMGSRGIARCTDSGPYRSRPDYYLRMDGSTMFLPYQQQFLNSFGDDNATTYFIPWGRMGIEHAASNLINDRVLVGLRKAGSIVRHAAALISSDLQTKEEVAANGGQPGTNVTLSGLKIPPLGTASATNIVGANADGTFRKISVGTGLSLAANGTLSSSGSGGSATNAAGSDTQVQFNDGGIFGADSLFTYNKTSDTLTVSNNILNGKLAVGLTTASSQAEVRGSTYGTPILTVGDADIRRVGIGVDGQGSYYGLGFFWNGTEVLVVDSNNGVLVGASFMGQTAPDNGMLIQGNLGIATNVATMALNVAGEAHFSNFFTPTNTPANGDLVQATGTGGATKYTSTAAITPTTFTSFQYPLLDGFGELGGTIANTNHSLGVKPVVVNWVLLCIISDANFTVGDEIEVSSVYADAAIPAFTSGKNSTNVFLYQQIGFGGPLFAAGRTNQASIPPTNFVAKCYARP